ncbi:hypothetical protein WMY93_006445 [Mugilogobius chulae]|uniref:THAP-type domain-containing protein n=2 Tax=Mugilogobius chulae TaxID=88201 RepID=A0AAW0PJZ0_9GOBI
MGGKRRCSVVGCHGNVGLHVFPQDLEIRRQWLRAIGLSENYELPLSAGVCHLHFTRDSYSNLAEVEMGFAKQRRLERGAVPTLALPRPPSAKPPALLPKPTREIGCQTDPVLNKHAFVQAILKPSRRSKAVQARTPNRSVSCDTDTLMVLPLPGTPTATSTPNKRRRCEVSGVSDPSFHLDGSASSVTSTQASDEVPPHKVKKYIVHEDKLMELFQTCPVCSRHCVVEKTTIGSLLRVKQHCSHCEFTNDWSSQPIVNGIPSGNLQLCAAVLFSGSSFCQISKFLKAFNVQGVSEQCFHKHQARLLIPTVNWQWKLEQDQMIAEAVESGSVTLGGDMRADTPGHCAKFGSYTMMNLKTNKVIDIQLVQSNEVGNSVRMEKEGFERSLSLLKNQGVKIEAIVTDRHTGVQKYLREQEKDITHYFDPWHMGKGIGKKIDALGKTKGLQAVTSWRKSLVNHLYWSASTSTSGEEAVAKWSSVANHIQNVHSHDNPLFPHCLHQPLVGEEARQWLKPSTAPCEKLCAMLLSPRFLKDVAKMSPEYHTSSLESFHSLILRFAPKNVVFSFPGMLCRLKLAALHYNENAARPHAATSSGQLRYSIEYPKYKHGDFTVRALKTDPTSCYIDKLMGLLFESVVEDATTYQRFTEQIPIPEKLCARFVRPDKKDAVSRHRSRFFKSV